MGNLLGQGGFGYVLHAECERDRTPVAIKVASATAPGAAARLLEEAAAMRAIGPPHVPAVYDAARLPDGGAYLVMEYVRAPTLADTLAAQAGPLPLESFSAQSALIMAAVEAAHRHGFIHCDLKPENLFMLPAPPLAKLFDFGLVRRLTASVVAPETTGGDVEGTAIYMSPEQCAGVNVDVRTDLYALGVVFYEMLSTRPPFFGEDAQVKLDHAGRRPPRLSALVPIPAALEEVVLRCLAKQREQRFTDIAELREALAAALSRGGEAVHTPQAAPSMQATPNRGRRAAGLIFFQSQWSMGKIRSALSAFGGELAHASGGSYVWAFSHEVDNPVAQAVRLAEDSVVRGLCSNALVDLQPVTVMTKSDGSLRFMSPLFTRPDRFPGPKDPAGVLVTSAALALLDARLAASDAAKIKPVPGREDVFQLLPEAEPADQATIVREAAAPLIGRDDLVASLLDSARGALDQVRPTIATVLADPGFGKSHLCATLIQELRVALPSIPILEVRAREPAGGDADYALRELLNKTLELPEGKPPDLGRGLLADRLGQALAHEVWAGVALVLGWVAADAPELSGLAAAPGVLRAAAARAAALAMRRRAAETKLLLVLDDAQFADDTTLDALELGTMAEAAAPIWVCALGRPVFETSRPSWGERAQERLLLRLGPLDSASAARLCRRLLLPAENVPGPVIDRLVERTQGIPLLLVELVRGLKRDGLIRKHAKGGGSYVATDDLDKLPNLPLVEWLAGREVEALPATLAAHARLVALLGAEFTPPEIAGVLEELDRDGATEAFPLDAAVGTRRLIETGLLIAHRGDRLTFRHALVRDAICQSVPLELGRRIHLAACRFYRERAQLPEIFRLRRLAGHAARGGLREQAMTTYLTLGEGAQARHAYLEAENCFSQALEQMSDTERQPKTSAFKGRGLMRYRLGRYDDALADFARARTLAHELNERGAEIEVLLDEATALDWIDEYRKSKELVHEARALSASGTTALIEARLLMGEGRSCFRFSEDTEAADLLNRAAASAERLGDAGYETYVIALLLGGYILATLGRLDESERAFDLVIPLCQERGDKLHLGAALGNRSMLWTCRNEKDKLLADLHQLLEIAREMGNGRMEQQAHFYLGLYLYWLGELDTAEKHARRAFEIDDRRFGQSARPESALLLTRVLAARGETAAARQSLDDILARQARARAQGQREVELVPAEEVLVSMLDLATRNASGEDWDRLEQKAQEVLTGHDLIDFLERKALAALERSQLDDSARALAAALEVASKVPNVMRGRIKQTYDRVKGQQRS